MRAALVRLNDELEAGWGVRLTSRIGVNTGEVVAGDPTAGEHLVVGDPSTSPPGSSRPRRWHGVLIGPSTYRLTREAIEVEPVEPLELKGKAERVPAYRLLGARSPEEPLGQRTARSWAGTPSCARSCGGTSGARARTAADW